MQEISFIRLLTVELLGPKPFPAQSLHLLSDLWPEEQRELANLWPKIPLNKRRNLLKDLTDFSNRNLVYNFEAVASIALGDLDNDVFLGGIDLLQTTKSDNMFRVANNYDYGLKVNQKPLDPFERPDHEEWEKFVLEEEEKYLAEEIESEMLNDEDEGSLYSQDEEDEESFFDDEDDEDEVNVEQDEDDEDKFNFDQYEYDGGELDFEQDEDNEDEFTVEPVAENEDKLNVEHERDYENKLQFENEEDELPF